MRSLVLLLIVFVPNLAGQEIIEIRQTEPQLKVFIRTDNGVVVTNLSDLMSMADMFGPRSMQALNNRGLLDSLELVPEQEEKLKNSRSTLVSRSKESNPDIEKLLEGGVGSRIELANEYLKEIIELKKEFAKEVSEVVTLPFQNDVVTMFEFQRAIDRVGFNKAILLKPFVDNLEFDNEQRAEIEKINHETDKAIAKQVKKLRDAAKRKIEGLMDAKQKDLIEEMSEPWNGRKK